jgi:two-component system response regulator HydG
VVLSRNTYLDEDELTLLMADDGDPNGRVQSGVCDRSAGTSGNLPLEEVEKRSILEALNDCSGNKSEAARRLGITRKTLRKKLEKYETK